MTKELLIFIGHSDDAIKEVEAVSTLEVEFQKFLRRHVKNLDSPISSVKMFLWENDANLGVGGQKVAINPFLESADIALFIFKQRIGKGTWDELQYCRENRRLTIAIFPAKHPTPEQLNDEKCIEEWMDLTKKRKSLQEDWFGHNSTSLTPVDPYKDIEDLKGIVRERISDLIPDIIFKHSNLKKKDETKNGPIQNRPWPFSLDLDQESGTLEFSTKVVENFRSNLRKEYKSRYPETLGDLTFLRKMGFVRNDRLTLAGVLLFCDKPSAYLKSALTRASKYEGDTKSFNRVRVDIDDSVINQILLSREFIETHVDHRDYVSDESTESKRVFRYPMKCVREVLANALCHRDYNDNYRFVYVTVFDDRIEISNPGEWGNRTLNEGAVIPFTDILGRPVEKNLPLARAISAINFMEMEGSGIETAITNCLEEGAPIPEVVYENGYITVKIFPRKNWEVHKIQNEFLLVGTDENFVLDEDAARTAVQFQLKVARNWAREVFFQGGAFGKDIQDISIGLNFWVSPSKLRYDVDKGFLTDLEFLISQHQNCVILGPPGSGKTTALKLLVNLVLHKNSIDGRFNLPIIIRLRELRAITFKDFYTFISKQLGLVFKIGGKVFNLASQIELSPHQTLQLKKNLIVFLEQNESLLLLDGLDEIADLKLRELVLKEAREFSYDLKTARIFLTCRTGTFLYRLENFTTYEISPLNNSQIIELSKKWLGERSNQFLEAVNESSLYHLVRTPILLSHLLTIYEKWGALPPKPKDIYKRVVNLFLEEWDIQRNVYRYSTYGNFDVERKFEFLTAMSFHLTFEIGKSSFSKNDVKRIYNSLAETYKLPKAEALQVIKELESTTGIFAQSGFDSFEFTHKSIQEFLCAEFMVKRPNSWDLSYLGFPDVLAIAVSISSNPNFYFINTVRHLYKNHELGSNFIVRYLSRLTLEKPDFMQSKELALSFYFLLTKVIVGGGGVTEIARIENIILSISSNSIDLQIRSACTEVSSGNAVDIRNYFGFEFINIPEEYKLYRLVDTHSKPAILDEWPRFIIMRVG